MSEEKKRLPLLLICVEIIHCGREEVSCFSEGEHIFPITIGHGDLKNVISFLGKFVIFDNLLFFF